MGEETNFQIKLKIRFTLSIGLNLFAYESNNNPIICSFLSMYIQLWKPSEQIKVEKEMFDYNPNLF